MAASITQLTACFVATKSGTSSEPRQYQRMWAITVSDNSATSKGANYFDSLAGVFHFGDSVRVTTSDGKWAGRVAALDSGTCDVQVVADDVNAF